MTKKVAVFRKEELLAGQSKVVTVEGRELAVFNVEGRFHALANACPHIGAPLGEGFVEDQQVTCPWHAWKFNVATGRCSVGNSHAESFPTAVEGDWVMVELPVEEPSVN